MAKEEPFRQTRGRFQEIERATPLAPQAGSVMGVTQQR